MPLVGAGEFVDIVPGAGSQQPVRVRTGRVLLPKEQGSGADFRQPLAQHGIRLGQHGAHPDGSIHSRLPPQGNRLFARFGLDRNRDVLSLSRDLWLGPRFTIRIPHVGPETVEIEPDGCKRWRTFQALPEETVEPLQVFPDQGELCGGEGEIHLLFERRFGRLQPPFQGTDPTAQPYLLRVQLFPEALDHPPIDREAEREAVASPGMDQCHRQVARHQQVLGPVREDIRGEPPYLFPVDQTGGRGRREFVHLGLQLVEDRIVAHVRACRPVRGDRLPPQGREIQGTVRADRLLPATGRRCGPELQEIGRFQGALHHRQKRLFQRPSHEYGVGKGVEGIAKEQVPEAHR